MVWCGEIVFIEADETSLNIDGKKIQDLVVDLAKGKNWKNLKEGQSVTITFVMKRAGGCLLPFSGSHAIIQPICKLAKIRK